MGYPCVKMCAKHKLPILLTCIHDNGMIVISSYSSFFSACRIEQKLMVLQNVYFLRKRGWNLSCLKWSQFDRSCKLPKTATVVCSRMYRNYKTANKEKKNRRPYWNKIGHMCIIKEKWYILLQVHTGNGNAKISLCRSNQHADPLVDETCIIRNLKWTTCLKCSVSLSHGEIRLVACHMCEGLLSRAGSWRHFKA